MAGQGPLPLPAPALAAVVAAENRRGGQTKERRAARTTGRVTVARHTDTDADTTCTRFDTCCNGSQTHLLAEGRWWADLGPGTGHGPREVTNHGGSTKCRKCRPIVGWGMGVDEGVGVGVGMGHDSSWHLT
ncbi:GL21296 [Drosophila persimilis]|uniref:GL21296 n=1 Tax=Drosophila persimilis TaxID=7234 RepID=B4HC52_DROPE|nr:GL21296 [Drosophila persimilis]